MAPPTATTYLVGNCDSLQAVLKCSGEGGGRHTSGWAWWRTPRQSNCRGPPRVGSKNSVASGEWRWGDRKAGSDARAQQRGRGGDEDVESWPENGWETVAIPEEGESGDFLFLFPCGSQCCLLGRSDIEAHQHASRRNGCPKHSIIVLFLIYKKSGKSDSSH
jgi:hypothetical protein